MQHEMPALLYVRTTKKHGVPELKELLNIAEQLAECGVFSVGLTGGEPMMREDFGEIVEALSAREIRITEIYTNGWLVNEALLKMLERNGQRPSFQLSYDGMGMHDYLRGIPGAEERVTEALKLLNQRNYRTSVSMCLHRKNKDTLKDTVSFLADLGVTALKCSSIMELGEWTNAETEKLRLSRQEELEIYEQYIPQYFAENAPLSLELSGAFLYERGMNRWRSFYHRECLKEQEAKMPACSSLLMAFYIGPDGTVAPCQGMCDCNFAKIFPNLKEKPLREILTDSKYVSLSHATVRDVRNCNEDCRRCEYRDRCSGGCRNAALVHGDNYFGPDYDACWFFKNGWEERIKNAAQPSFEAYRNRCPEAFVHLKEEDPFRCV